MTNKYTELYFSAKLDKIDLLRKYCAERNLQFLMVVENVPENKLEELDKFLVDNEILEDKYETK